MPTRFSWVDQRVVRDGYVFRCSSEALGLYLILVAVADRNGLSFYRDRSIGKLLRCNEERIRMLRRELVDGDLVAYRAPFYQVLSLDAPTSEAPVTDSRPIVPAMEKATEDAASSEQVRTAVAAILREMGR